MLAFAGPVVLTSLKKNPCPAPLFTRMLSGASNRPSVDDVNRLSRGQAAKRRGTGSRAVPHRLNAEEREGYDRAVQHGFLTLESNLGSRRERKGSPLFNTWRMWNDAQKRPAIFLVKRGARLPLDEVWIDLSTFLRPMESILLRSPVIVDLINKVDAVTAADGVVQSDETVINIADVADHNDQAHVVELDHEGFVPTWQIAELWVKYRFDERSLAKKSARNISRLFGGPQKTEQNNKGRSERRKRSPLIEESDH